MKRFTACSLVHQYYCANARITQQRINRAAEMARVMERWQLAFRPTARRKNRVVVGVRTETAMATLLAMTFKESCSHADSQVWVSFDRIERATGNPVGTEACVNVLSRHGLVIKEVGASAWALRGVNPDLAQRLNSVHQGNKPRGGWDTYKLVKATMGMPERPKALSVTSVVNTDDLLKTFDVVSDGLLERRRRTHLYPKWMLPQVLQTQ